MQDVSPLLCHSESSNGPLLCHCHQAAQVRDSSEHRHFTPARVKQQESTLCTAPLLSTATWACQQHARGNSGQKTGAQSVGGTFPVPTNKNKPSKGLVIGIQATQKARTPKLERIPNISLEVQLIECFQWVPALCGRASTSTRAGPRGREG